MANVVVVEVRTDCSRDVATQFFSGRHHALWVIHRVDSDALARMPVAHEVHVILHALCHVEDLDLSCPTCSLWLGNINTSQELPEEETLIA
jgi:hypothetical protein